MQTRIKQALRRTYSSSDPFNIALYRLLHPRSRAILPAANRWRVGSRSISRFMDAGRTTHRPARALHTAPRITRPTTSGRTGAAYLPCPDVQEGVIDDLNDLVILQKTCSDAGSAGTRSGHRLRAKYRRTASARRRSDAVEDSPTAATR
jgi:hypothetical protein